MDAHARGHILEIESTMSAKRKSASARKVKRATKAAKPAAKSKPAKRATKSAPKPRKAPKRKSRKTAVADNAA